MISIGRRVEFGEFVGIVVCRVAAILLALVVMSNIVILIPMAFQAIKLLTSILLATLVFLVSRKVAAKFARGL